MEYYTFTTSTYDSTSPCTISFRDFPSSHGWWKVTERQGSPEVLVSPLCPMIGSVGYQLLSPTTGGWPTPLKNLSSSVGMIIPISYIYIWKIIKHVPDHQPVMVKFPFPTCHCWKNPTCCSFNLLPQWIIPWVSLAPHWRQHRAGSQYVADRFTIHWHWGHGGGHLNFASKSAHSMQLKSKFARISRMALEIHKSLK